MPQAQLGALLSSLSQSISPVLGTTFSKRDFCPLDLSIDNNNLHSVDLSSVPELGKFVDSVILKHKAKVAYGGYLEKRGIYRRSTYFNQLNPKTERSIHLGLDLWTKAGTPVYAPLHGRVHSFKNNTNFGDYGPCLILEHHFGDFMFFTLYGHLSLDSLEDKSEGQIIPKGAVIATLGTAEVNGSYPPHLHFQIIKDIQNNYGDYPGVCNVIDLEFYRENCPDPNLLLALPQWRC